MHQTHTHKKNTHSWSDGVYQPIDSHSGKKASILNVYVNDKQIWLKIELQNPFYNLYITFKFTLIPEKNQDSLNFFNFLPHRFDCKHIHIYHANL